MKKLLLTAGLYVSLQCSGFAAPTALAPKLPEGKVFDIPSLLSTPLNARVLKSEEKDGIVTEEVMFHSERDGEKDVEIFAYFSFPKGAKRLPGFIWNQGGLARASTYWTEFGARRGYATLCIDFPQPGYRSTGEYPINTRPDMGDDPRQAPIYHGAVALLKAVSFLQSREEVDGTRIGMAGSSWGGFFTTLMVGLDARLKVGSAMFGTGSIDLGNLWWDADGRSGQRDAGFRERWRTTLDPAWRLQTSKTPMAWFSGTNDTFYWMPALMQTYSLTAGEKHLSLLPNWDHGLTPQIDEQVFAWLDSHLIGTSPFIQVSPLHVAKRGRNLVAEWTFGGQRTATSAELIFSYGAAGNWTNRYWITRPAKIEGNRCSIALPASTLPLYISGTVVDADGFRYSTPLAEVLPSQFDKRDRPAMPSYDGASLWGDFEEPQVKGFLDPLGWRHPAIVEQPHTGRQAAQLTAGKTTLPRLYFTAGVPHQFTCWLKADRPASVTVELRGAFDSKPLAEKKQVQIGTSWTAISLNMAPPQALFAELYADITVPDATSVLLDTVSFKPQWVR